MEIKYWKTEGLSRKDFDFMEVRLVKGRKYYYIDGEGGAATFFGDHPVHPYSGKKDFSVKCYGKKKIRITEKLANLFLSLETVKDLKNIGFRELYYMLNKEK